MLLKIAMGMTCGVKMHHYGMVLMKIWPKHLTWTGSGRGGVINFTRYPYLFKLIGCFFIHAVGYDLL